MKKMSTVREFNRFSSLIRSLGVHDVSYVKPLKSKFVEVSFEEYARFSTYDAHESEDFSVTINFTSKQIRITNYLFIDVEVFEFDPELEPLLRAFVEDMALEVKTNDPIARFREFLEILQ